MSPKATDPSEKKPRRTAVRSRARKTEEAGASLAVDTPAPADDAVESAPKKRTTSPRKRAAAAAATVPAEKATPARRATAKAAPKKAATATRGRKKAAAVEDEAPAPVETTPVESATVETDIAPAAKPRRRRATKVKAEETEAAAASPEPETVAAPEEESPLPRKRKSTRATATEPKTKAASSTATRGRRKAAATESAAVPTDGEAPADTQPLHVTGALDVAMDVTPTEAVTVEAAAAVAPVEVEASPKDAAPKADQPVFADLGLSEPILRAVSELGYVHPTPIQTQAIPAVLQGQDVLGVAQTGTGKTASFTLPMLEILWGSRARARMPRSLILEPTRELALQVAENFVKYGKYLKLNHALLIGGESMADQKEVLNRGVDVLIATPGRLIDLFERGGLLLNQTRILVIDEADRMLDMGFIPDIERIVGLLPRTRQTLFFSATMAPEIKRLADAFLQSPREITVSRPSTVATTIKTGLVVVEEREKRKTLRHMLRAEELQNAIIFCNRKRDVDVLLKSLLKHGFSAGALHGDLPQSVRFQTLERFRSGELKILVCSDVAARGIDIGGLSHVFNFDLPFHAEDYVHRIGRTGRAGREGRAYSLATPHDRKFAEAIETLTGKPIPRLELAGVAQQEWVTEEAAREGRDRKPRRERNRDSRDDKTTRKTRESRPEPRAEARPEPRPEPRAARPARNAEREERRPDRRREKAYRGSEIADAPAESVQGFGVDVPAFMTLPRRVSVYVEGMAEDAADS